MATPQSAFIARLTPPMKPPVLMLSLRSKSGIVFPPVSTPRLTVSRKRYLFIYCCACWLSRTQCPAEPALFAQKARQGSGALPRPSEDMYGRLSQHRHAQTVNMIRQLYALPKPGDASGLHGEPSSAMVGLGRHNSSATVYPASVQRVTGSHSIEFATKYAASLQHARVTTLAYEGRQNVSSPESAASVGSSSSIGSRLGLFSDHDSRKADFDDHKYSLHPWQVAASKYEVTTIGRHGCTSTKSSVSQSTDGSDDGLDTNPHTIFNRKPAAISIPRQSSRGTKDWFKDHRAALAKLLGIERKDDSSDHESPLHDCDDGVAVEEEDENTASQLCAVDDCDVTRPWSVSSAGSSPSRQSFPE